MSTCKFCKIAAGEIPSAIVYQDEDIVAFRDINPQAPTHIQIITRRHIPTVQDLADEDSALIAKMVLSANRLADEEFIAPKGYRLVFNCRVDGGQEIYHLHLHLLGGRRMTWPPG
ncbi:MAG: histidine triad nucleotide-binding protein [Calditrichaeota bacterium]|nr:histidine triad nucleotide-binding protein [Calditrichota bacterium]